MVSIKSQLHSPFTLDVIEGQERRLNWRRGNNIFVCFRLNIVCSSEWQLTSWSCALNPLLRACYEPGEKISCLQHLCLDSILDNFVSKCCSGERAWNIGSYLYQCYLSVFLKRWKFLLCLPYSPYKIQNSALNKYSLNFSI